MLKTRNMLVERKVLTATIVQAIEVLGLYTSIALVKYSKCVVLLLSFSLINIPPWYDLWCYNGEEIVLILTLHIANNFSRLLETLSRRLEQANALLETR